MLYSDRLKKYREKENRGVLNAGDFGVLLLLMHCLEAHSNVLVNCKTGRRFTNRKDIADYVNMSRKNVFDYLEVDPQQLDTMQVQKETGINEENVTKLLREK